MTEQQQGAVPRGSPLPVILDYPTLETLKYGHISVDCLTSLSYNGYAEARRPVNECDRNVNRALFKNDSIYSYSEHDV